MDAEKITMYRPLEDKSGAVKQFPATVSSQVFDEETGKTVVQQFDDVAQQLAQSEKKLEGTINVAEYGIISDGVSDQTVQLVSLFSSELASMRGEVTIPYNTKFKIVDVYASLGSGIVLRDNSAINFANSAGYKNKMITIGSSDKVADDTGFMIMSGHHPALFINNIGTSNTHSSGSLASILFGAGIKSNGSPFTGFMQQQTTGSGKFKMGWRVQHLFNDPNTVIDRTVFEFDETGKAAIGGGIAEQNLRITNLAGETSTRMLLDNRENGSTSSIELRAKTTSGATVTKRVTVSSNGKLNFVDGAGSVIFDIDENGFTNRVATVPQWRTISGDSPNVLNGSNFLMSNTSPTDLTAIPATGNREIRILFTDGNTTLKNGVGIRLKGGLDWKPTPQSSITLVRVSTLSSSWIEVARTEI